MSEELTTSSDKAVQCLKTRDQILKLEEELGKLDNAVRNHPYPLKHSFSEGMYVREITIPADVCLTGMIHKHEHPNFLMSGTVRVITESGGLEELVGPISMISPAGTKRALYTVTEVVWITVHANPDNIRDIDTLVRIATADSYEEYDKFKAKELPWTKRLLRLLKISKTG